MAVINDDGQGLLDPIMRCGDLLYCQQSDGEYTICEKDVGIVQTLGYDEPSEEFKKGLEKLGFINV